MYFIYLFVCFTIVADILLKDGYIIDRMLVNTCPTSLNYHVLGTSTTTIFLSTAAI